MDKYQEFLLSRLRIWFVKEADKPLGDCLNAMSGVLDLKQDENYNIVKYNLLFEPDMISYVQINGKKYKELVPVQDFRELLAVPVDFTKRAGELVISLKNNALDDIHIKLNYIEVDKRIFDAKEADRIRRETAEKAQIRIATGTDLVNVYFQPCSDECAKTVVELYSVTNGRMLLGKFAVEEGMFFKAITGLAYGSYEVKVAQFDKNGKELFISDPIPFELKKPHYGGDGKHTVII